MAKNKIKIITVKIKDITPYKYNPRDNSLAIKAVASSIKEFGFLVPCVIDTNNVLVSGHTRVEAAKSLRITSVPCIVADNLTEEQIRSFRIIDNKTSELASWDMELLSGEVEQLLDSDIDLTSFGFSAEDIEGLVDVVDLDALDEDENKGLEDIQEHISAKPKSIRAGIGEVTFFIEAEQYKEWSHNVRKDNDYNMQKIIDDLAGRLGLTAKQIKTKKG